MQSVFSVAATILLAAGSSTLAQVTLVPQTPLQGSVPDEAFGFSVASGRDVNNDGYDDFVIGVLNNLLPGGSNTGAILVYSGRDSSILRTIEGEAFALGHGYSVALADVNNDGFADIVAGRPFDDTTANNAGAVRVYSGADGAVLHDWYGLLANDQFGFAVAAAGDVNNDGFDDVIVNAPFADPNGGTSGQVRVFSGADGSVLYTMDGEHAGHSFGFAIAAAGDMNNDGFDDLLIGSPGARFNGMGFGSAELYSGFDGSLLRTYFAPEPGQQYGGAIASAGDVNNDGVPDVIIGAVGSGTDRGDAYVYSGATGFQLQQLEGTSNSSRFGRTVSTAGDVNDDGFADVMVGAPFTTSSSNPGRVVVFSGSDWSVLYTFVGGGDRGELFGQTIAYGGDLNGDSHPDLVLGAPEEDGLPGSVTVVLSDDGKAAPCPGDTNGDNIVNFADLNAVLAAFGQTGAGLAADLNDDGVVNFTDLNEVLANFGATCSD